MSEVRIVAEQRTEFGKGGARRTRRAGKVPAVLYGHGAPPRHIALPARELTHALAHDANVVFHLDLADGAELALAKDVQRDPLKHTIDHVDLVIVRRGEKVTVDVPVAIVGESPAGTIVDHQLTAVPVQAEAMHIPGAVEIDVAGLEVGSSITAGQLSLPGDVRLAVPDDTVVVHGLPAPSEEQVEAELAGAEAELGAGPAGAGAAEQAAAAAPGTVSGAGDVVPDTASGEGGPGEPQAAGTAARPTSGG